MKAKGKRMKRSAQAAAILTGTFLMAFTFYHINFQNHLSEGGFVGLSLLGEYAFGFPPALTILILDIPFMLLFALRKGWRSMGPAALAAGSFTVFYAGMEHFSTLSFDLQGQLWLAALLSGLLTGVGGGLVLRCGGATGGDDCAAIWLHEKTGLKIGTVFILMDASVLLLSLLYLPLAETLYTVAAVCIGGKVITWTVEPQILRQGLTSIAHLFVPAKPHVPTAPPEVKGLNRV
ncbi:YitT family protein [Saccharibacillus kuerlensis]|uniref:Membrane protein n=1 Tax=Saccharibacillus kuerlensis TaxID=459527 RepID=A0ABQ2KWU1_9BACL|nr:YitT family protein [Saccharibacillus kuerlensis]GGN95668.1 membrane protein [Saccharibacillus kuerlensis]